MVCEQGIQARRSYEEAFGEAQQESLEWKSQQPALEQRKRKKQRKTESASGSSSLEDVDEELPTSTEEPTTPTVASKVTFCSSTTTVLQTTEEQENIEDDSLQFILETYQLQLQKAQEQRQLFQAVWSSLPTSYIQNERISVVRFIVGVGTDFNLQCKTTSLAILLFDRVKVFLEGLHRRDYIFFVLVCIELASKLEEEVSCSYTALMHNYLDPNIPHYASISMEQMIQFESVVLNLLQFNLNLVTVFDFLPLYLEYGFTNTSLSAQKIVENLKIVYFDSQEDCANKVTVSNQNVDYEFRTQIEQLCRILLLEAYSTTLQMNQQFTVNEIAAASIVCARKNLGARDLFPESLKLILGSHQTIQQVSICAALFDTFLSARSANAPNRNVIVS